MRVALLFCFAASLLAQGQGIGLFESQSDIGENPKAGSASFDASTGEYRITGGGDNIWDKTDAFHYVWKRISGDFTITADVHFVGTGAVDHRKAVLMARQSLDGNAPYADVALHGDGLTSLQYRLTSGGETQEVRAEKNAPVRIRLVRHKDEFTMYVGSPGEELQKAGQATVPLSGPVYLGLGVCSHDAKILETALFTHVTVEQSHEALRMKSHVSIYDLEDKSVHVIYSDTKRIEAPNWSHDGKSLLLNSGGRIYRLAVDGKASLVPVGIDPDYECNNDHGPSPDGKRIAFSAEPKGSDGSRVFVAQANGKSPKQVTATVPSYFHGWSPDGRWLVFVASQNHNFDLFRIDTNGGKEERLTTHAGYDDGPDYSPDGKWIYFNSNRSGGWDIWRMPAEGAGPGDELAQRITSDGLEDWFPHPSPNGKWLVFLSFPEGTSNHDAECDIELRMMPLPGENPGSPEIQSIVKLFGGQGTINVNSWSPDSRRFAFVRYEVIKP